MSTRKKIDCRQFPSEKHCTVAISGSEEEVITLATHHAVQAHGHQDSEDLREQIRALLTDADD